MEHVFHTDHAGTVTLAEITLDAADRRPMQGDAEATYVVTDASGNILATFGSLEHALHWIGHVPTTGAGCEVDSFAGPKE